MRFARIIFVLVLVLVLVLERLFGVESIMWTGLSFFVPKGLKDSARGFNPWCDPKNAPPRRGGRTDA